MRRTIPGLLTSILGLAAMIAGADTDEVSGAVASAPLTVQQIIDR